MTSSRPSIVGPDTGPGKPFPYTMEGRVIAGFGRGSKELGIPTANLPVDASLTPWIASIPSGIYFGHASLALPDAHPQKTSAEPAIYPMVMSIGYNPFYKNAVRSAEVHLLHDFAADFYDAHMRLLILGFIRDERDYESVEALVDDIRFDCRVARGSLERAGWRPEDVSLRVDGGHGQRNGAEWLVRKL